LNPQQAWRRQRSGRKKRHVPSLTDVWAAIAERKRNREQEEAPKAKHRRQENGTEMTTEGSCRCAWQTGRQQLDGDGDAADKRSKSHGERQEFPIRVSSLRSVCDHAALYAQAKSITAAHAVTVSE